MPPTLRQKVESSDIRAWTHFLHFADFCLRKGLLTEESLIKNRKANLRSEKMLSLISYNYLPLVFFAAFSSFLSFGVQTGSKKRGGLPNRLHFCFHHTQTTFQHL